MVVFHRLTEVPCLEQGAVLAIGNFDGIHLGHQIVLNEVVVRASAIGQMPALLTFFPHPVELLKPGNRLLRLTTASEKLTLLERMGMGLVLVAPFDQELQAMGPKEFFDKYIVQGMRALSVHVGHDFRFGHGRSGDVALLEELCRSHGVSLHVQQAVEVDGLRCSSTAIRAALSDGNLQQANSMLGRPYSLNGQVVRGEGRGRQLGFPTANLRLASEKLLPKTGVYLTQATWQRQTFLAVANLGLRPTFSSGETKPLLEVHLMQFNMSVYDEFLEIQFLKRIRDERKFDSVEALKKQITADIAWAKENAPN